MKKVLITLTATCCFSILLHAQPVDIGINLGVMAYNGDLAPDSPFDMVQQIRPSFGIFGRTSFSQKLSAKLMINFGKVDGDDSRSPYPERGLNFESKIQELTLTGELHPFRVRHTESSFTYPYLFAGVGLYHFNPTTQVGDSVRVALQPLGTEGQGLPGYGEKYARTQVNVPFGLGIRFIFNDRFSVSLEAGARYLLTDYLDDVSATIVNHKELFEGNGPLAAQLSNPRITANEPLDQTYRRGSAYKDWYYQLGILVSYNFGDALRKAFRDPVPCFSKW